MEMGVPVSLRAALALLHSLVSPRLLLGGVESGLVDSEPLGWRLALRPL